jgi:hypothetical protein
LGSAQAGPAGGHSCFPQLSGPGGVLACVLSLSKSLGFSLCSHDSLRQMLPLLLLLVTTQVVPCAPSDNTVVCQCKQGRASACEALRQTSPQLADAIEKAMQAVKAAEEAQQQSDQAAKSKARAASGSSEPPNCKGQQHHVISRPLAKALEDRKTLRGLYNPRDPRFVTKAVDEQAHCGYQGWHRDVDAEVIAWLEANGKATPKEFEALLREIYSRAAMRARFPNGF